MTTPSVKEVFQRRLGKERLATLGDLLADPMLHDALHTARASMTERPGITENHYQGVVWFLDQLFYLIEAPQPPPKPEKKLVYAKPNTTVRA